MDIIITPGHYQTKSSVNAEKAEIIRIIGADKNSENNWITDEGKSISSYYLESDYVRLATFATEEDARKKPKTNLFADFEEVTEDDLKNKKQPQISQTPPIRERVQQPVITNEQQIQRTPEDLIPEVLNNFEPTPNNKETFIETPNKKFSVIEKVSIGYLNNKTFESTGVYGKLKPTSINVNVPLEINYNIPKLKNTIELLDLDENEILDWIVANSMDEVKSILKGKLKKYLDSGFEEVITKPEIKNEPVFVQTPAFNPSEPGVYYQANENITPKPIVVEQPIQPIIEQPIQPIIEQPKIDLEKQISSIDDYLLSLKFKNQ